MAAEVGGNDERFQQWMNELTVALGTVNLEYFCTETELVKWYGTDSKPRVVADYLRERGIILDKEE